MMNAYLQVAIGGAIGATARFAVYQVASLWTAPISTLLINVVGSFAMGVLAYRIGPAYAPLLMAGVLGGFTTFSAFSLDALSLWNRGLSYAAIGYVVLSVVLSLIAVGVGMALGKGLWA